MTFMIRIALALTMALAAAAPARGQQDRPLTEASRPQAATMYELLMTDGSRLFGTILQQSEQSLVFRTHAGATLTVQRTEIARLREVSGIVVRGEFQIADPNATRLFFGPTGRSLKKGQTYLGVFEFLLPFVQVGITDRLSIGGGSPLVFGFDEADRPFWLTPKFQVYNDGARQFAIGVFHGFSANDDGAGIAYGVGTFGRQDSSLTVGAGLAYAGSDDRAAVIMVGGERQFSRSMKLVTENYLWKGGDGVASAGIRFFGERLSADVALAFPIGADMFFAFPVVNFVYLF